MTIPQSLVLLLIIIIIFISTDNQTFGYSTTTISNKTQSFGNLTKFQPTNETVVEFLQRGLFDKTNKRNNNQRYEESTEMNFNENSTEGRGFFLIEKNLTTRSVKKIDDPTDIGVTEVSRVENEKFGKMETESSVRFSEMSPMRKGINSKETKVGVRIMRKERNDNGTTDNWSVSSLKGQIFNDEPTAEPSLRILTQLSDVDEASKKNTGRNNEELSSDRPLQLVDNEAKRDNESLGNFRITEKDNEDLRSLKNVETKVKSIMTNWKNLSMNHRKILSQRFNCFLASIEKENGDDEDYYENCDCRSRHLCCKKKCCCGHRKKGKRKNLQASLIQIENNGIDRLITKDTRRTISEGEENIFRAIITTTQVPAIRITSELSVIKTTAAPSTTSTKLPAITMTTAVPSTTSTEEITRTTTTPAPPQTVEKISRTNKRRNHRKKHPIAHNGKITVKNGGIKKKCRRGKKTKRKEAWGNTMKEKFDEDEQEESNYPGNMLDVEENELGTFTEAPLRGYEFG